MKRWKRCVLYHNSAESRSLKFDWTDGVLNHDCMTEPVPVWAKTARLLFMQFAFTIPCSLSWPVPLCYTLFLPSILMLFFFFFLLSLSLMLFFVSSFYSYVNLYFSPSISFSYVILFFKHSITFSFCLFLCYSLFLPAITFSYVILCFFLLFLC